MKLFRTLYLALASSALLLTSCVDLDKDPSEWVHITKESEVVDLLKSSYPQASFQWLSEMCSDNIIDNNCPHVPYSTRKAQTLAHYNLSTYDLFDNEIFQFAPATLCTYNTDDSPGMLWSQYYASVSSVNYALQYIDEIGGTDNSQLSSTLRAAKGEALLIRAYDHFMLVNLFCQPYKNEEESKADQGIAYVTEVVTTVQKDFPRGTVTETYQKIKADLEEGLSLLTDNNYEAPKYHFNTSAAHAFAARVALYTRDWDGVIEHANAVLGTGSTDMDSKLMDYSIFTECSSSTDYANAWQNPDLANNLMLTTTYSLLCRHAAGYRYATNSIPLREIFYHIGPTWSGWLANPTAIVGGFTFYRSDADYGFFPSKIMEQFEYTNKNAGNGYAHIVMRTFTATELLLERAEAKIMKADYAGGMADILAYDKNRQNFAEKDKLTYSMTEPTETLLLNYYSKSTNSNCYDDWSFTQKVSSDYVIPEAAVPYMNAINDMRRFETWLEGLRWFDIKRWGMTVTHEVGTASTQYTVAPGDEKLAIEIPWETISAGVTPSRSTTSTSSDVNNAADAAGFMESIKNN